MQIAYILPFYVTRVPKSLSSPEDFTMSFEMGISKKLNCMGNGKERALRTLRSCF